MNPTSRALARLCGWALFLLSWSAVGPSAQARDVIVFGASSLTDALTAIADQYRADHGGTVVTAFAGTSSLARQIENGAPADIFIAANKTWMDYVDERDLIARESRLDLARNSLVIVAPADSDPPPTIRADLAFADQLRDGRLAIGDPDHVPVGIYTKTALQNMGLWADLATRTARMNNVRATLALVARGEVPLGIVYRTDARISDQVVVVGQIPQHLHPPIVYPAAVVAGRDATEVIAFFNYLRSPAARSILAGLGFVVD